MPELTDLSVIRTLCEKYDFALSKGFGQNLSLIHILTLPTIYSV